MIDLSSDSFPKDLAALEAFRAACLAGQIAYRSIQMDGSDIGRATRAAALVLSRDKRPYHTTAEACSCPDSWYRHRVCKHRLAMQNADTAGECHSGGATVQRG